MTARHVLYAVLALESSCNGKSSVVSPTVHGNPVEAYRTPVASGLTTYSLCLYDADEYWLRADGPSNGNQQGSTRFFVGQIKRPPGGGIDFFGEIEGHGVVSNDTLRIGTRYTFVRAPTSIIRCPGG